ncbi:Bifunctional protein FolD (Includes: Methylenetetrahydrofolate dehydrogenase; Methenyltetrahydrofolate cyclohydrolase) [[Clostridium] ultunense Esp]|uniref:Bifunctional protein FolD n=1 Tax=[Clostridium] ultunense Esp TaxID=1288971 RepID=M1Z479_9FIRM|nr:bifunctional 5,10-methylenetetrahydrofolate dehydrogenase/5,10-methenyltetrahydrofolate cyclohydrolase [Schnuerera ultunensis]CCQ92559.1 Bifunctional protein FolD (Includes: Methylenetetrahydrofolate dehydrogenase; Methenyltetrahydrofolate cyclohydrolase) [[Clostridium] ultunense Esp]SHD77330.1 Bifunctional protein folD [Includes: Methylenetetrahydrofolate dehydrogenase; Methenyltetrahydrofolate cyclohydrolase] [[Clostridium] ultunense Esp]
MAEILKGNVVAAQIKEKMKKDIEELAKHDKIPTLAIVRLGNNPGDVSYEKSIIKNCDNIGIKSKVFERDVNIKTEELIELIEELNKHDNISGILVFRPLPSHIDEEIIRNTISPLKDVDCMHPLNLERIFEGDMDGFAPCTPKAAMEMLKHYKIPLEGKNVVVVNRSMVVGKPLAMMLLKENATVTICHSRTKNLEEITNRADVVVVALGKAKFFDEKYFNENSIVIDVGVSLDQNGKLSGDAYYDKLSPIVNKITPVPGGVGSVTTSILLSQVVLACKNI